MTTKESIEFLLRAIENLNNELYFQRNRINELENEIYRIRVSL